MVGIGFLSWSQGLNPAGTLRQAGEPQPLPALPLCCLRLLLEEAWGRTQGAECCTCGNGDLRWGTRRLCRKCYIITTAATRSKVLVSSRVTRLRGGTEASARVTGTEVLPRAQGCWGRGAGPRHHGRLCPGGLSFGPHRDVCRSVAPEVPSCCQEPMGSSKWAASPSTETKAKGLAVPLGS